jgi:hypothetical protein
VRHTDLDLLLNAMTIESSKDEDFYRFIEQRPVHEKVFLMTDNLDTQWKYISKYPNKIIVFDSILPLTECVQYGLRCTSITQTVIEMYIAIHAKVFEGSKVSTISETIRIIRSNIRNDSYAL